MKPTALVRRMWVTLMLSGFVITGYYVLSTSKYVRKGQRKLKGLAEYILSQTNLRCKWPAQRSEAEVVQCLQQLEQEVIEFRRDRARRRRLRKLTNRTRPWRGQRMRDVAARHYGTQWDDEEAMMMKKRRRRRPTKFFEMQRQHGYAGASRIPRLQFRNISGNESSELLNERDVQRMRAANIRSSNQRLFRQNTPLPFNDRLQQNRMKQEFSKRFHIPGSSLNLSSSALQQIKERFQQRQMVLQKGCQLYHNSSLFKPLQKCSFLLPSPPQAVGLGARYCSIQKTGSTTWIRLLRDIGKERLLQYGKTESFSPQNVKLTKDCDGKKAQGIARQGQDKETSFVFVREPYSRLLSAYVDKLFSPNTLFWSRPGRHIVRMFRHNPSELSLSCGQDVTFAEFVRYVIHMQRTGQMRDGHFVPVHDHCRFCNTSYDYVGHLETLTEDMAYLLHVLQSPVNYSSPFELDTLSNNAAWVFHRMRSRIVQCMSLQEAGQRLWKKWQIRGLISKTEPFPFTGQQVGDLLTQNVVAAGLAAVERGGGLAHSKKQKAEALQEAYASVPLSDRRRLRGMFFLDFQLFGYDPDLPAVFQEDQSVSKTNFSYFHV